MINFRTEIVPQVAEYKIDIKNKILTIGSCFAENIGNKLEYYKFNSFTNPFGILYNPISIANSINKIIENEQIDEKDLVQHNDVWYSIFHHGKHADTNKTKLISKLNTLTNTSRQFLQNTDYVIFTMGTSWVYRLNTNKQIVANCHKLPANNFTRFALSVSHIADCYNSLLQKLNSINPNMQFLFTVSPVRHLKDGATQNQLSKATLLLAVSELVDKFTNAHYFPAYEIMIDDLRDYRFYNDDMLHPSPFAVNYIWQKFKETWVNTNTNNFIGQIEKLKKALNHRPFNPNTKAHQQFLQKQLNTLQQLQKKYTNVNLLSEIEQVKKQVLTIN